MRIYFLVIISMVLFSCRQECSLDECDSYLSKSQVVFRPGTVYGPGEVLRGLFQPSVLSTAEGSLLVFAQGRINSSEDNEDKVLILSRSEDGGQSWSAIEYLTIPASFWGVCAFLTSDQNSGEEKINVLLTYSKPKLFERYDAPDLMEHFNINAADYTDEDAAILYHLTSTDNGQSWARGAANENFMNAYHVNGNYVGFFSCVGQMNRVFSGPHEGRLISSGPVKYDSQPILDPDDIYDYPSTTSTMIYSDDEGMTWQMSGFAPHGGNESSVASIENGETVIMIRRRNSDYPSTKRIVNYSFDQGLTWTENAEVQDLASPKCLGILYDDGQRLLYTTPKDKWRTHGWVGYSDDDGISWKGKVMEPGLFSYSDIVRIHNSENYLVAYSLVHHGELGLAIRIFNEGWLLD